MIKPTAASLLTAAAYLALTVGAFEINLTALAELKRIDGYSRFFKIHPYLFTSGPLEGVKNYLIENESAIADVSFDGFRENIFLKPCQETTELYNRYKQYFDELPSTVIDFDSHDDFDRNLLCRVFAIVKDCKLYTEHSFVTRIHVALLAGLYLDTEIVMIQ